MVKNVIVKTNWDSRRKKGGWGADANGKTASGNVLSTTTDQLTIVGCIESMKKFGQRGDTLRFITKNRRAVQAIRHPGNSVNCALAREFKATAKAMGVRYTFE